MKPFLYVFTVCLAYVFSRAIPVGIEWNARLQQQRQSEEFLLELKGVQVIKPNVGTQHL